MKENVSKAVYTTGSIGKTMLKTAFSMLAGTLAMSGYNIADTYFVGQLGRIPLAAMGFTFPVIMLIGCVFRGLGVGVMTTAAQALGSGNNTKAAKLITSGLLLIFAVSVFFAVAGINCIESTFSVFGANDEVMPDIRAYMTVWYLGCCTASLGMAGNDLLIAAGDSKIASAMMMGGMIVNVVLDPLFIMGCGPVPAMGIRGAAIATVASQFISALVVLAVLARRHGLILFSGMPFQILKTTWTVIVRYAVPSTIGMLMMPIGSAIVTKVTACFGITAVAASAAAGRLEMVAFVFPMALGIALLPMIGQNYGARLYSRINQCRRFAMRFAFLFLAVMGVIYIIAAPQLVRLFSPDPEVRKLMVLYMRIIPFGFGMIEIHRYATFFFTGCAQPAVSAWLNALRILVLMIPLSLFALWLDSLPMLFAARMLADVLAGGIGCWMAHRMTRSLPEDGRAPYVYLKRPWYLSFLPGTPVKG